MCVMKTSIFNLGLLGIYMHVFVFEGKMMNCLGSCHSVVFFNVIFIDHILGRHTGYDSWQPQARLYVSTSYSALSL